MSIISQGTITSAAADYTQMPDVSFAVSCRQGYIHQIQPTQPTSINGAADVATLMSSLAQQMGYAFENKGVSVKLNYPYHWGPARVQAEEIARSAGIAWIIDKNKLAIWPKNGYRAGTPVMIAAGGKLVGYPTFIQYGVSVKALLDPSLEYGARIQVQSSLQPANGIWTVVNMAYELQSELPDGAWFMTIQAYKPNVVPGL